MRKRGLVCGVGINDADYKVMIHETVDGKDKIVWTCPYYRKWLEMLRRCYSKRYQEKQPTYKGCIVCNEWLIFSNFRKWMTQQEWQGWQLDKDFLIEGNKVYSEDTCIFAPNKVNNFITANGKMRGEYPLGVCLDKRRKKNPYKSECSDGNGVSIYLGVFPTPEQAHQAWLVKKLEICDEYLEEFNKEPLITQGLNRIKQKIKHHINTSTELTSF